MEEKYTIGDVMGDGVIDGRFLGRVVQKFNDFLIKKEFSGVLYCGEKIYKYLQLADKFEYKPLDEENLDFPIEFGKWVNGDQSFSLNFWPEKYGENDFSVRYQRA